MFKNTKEDKFIERDDSINETEQKNSSDKSFTDHTEIDKDKMPKSDEIITVGEQKALVMIQKNKRKIE